MRLRTQFMMTVLLFGVVLAAISASAIITNEQVQEYSQQEKIASSIVQGASELACLSNDYLIYRESQQLSRWQSRFASFSSDVASLHADKPEQQTLVSNIQANEQRLKEVFDSVIAAVGSSAQNQSGAVDPAFLQVSWSRIAVQSQGLVSDASRLAQLIRAQADQMKQTNMIVILAMIGIFFAYFLINYLLIQRRVLKSIAVLHAGTVVIGSGNLDFKIKERQNDEIGDLSRSFNQMTANLKTVTASKAEMEREIAERKKAEAKLAHLASFPELNPQIVLELDASGQIKYLNPATKTHLPDLSTLGIKHPFLVGWETLVNKLRNEKPSSIIREVNMGDFWYEQTASYVPATDSYRLYGRNITDRKRAEEELRRTRDYLENLLNYANAPVIVWDPSFNITQFNHAFERLTGWQAKEVLGKRLDVLFPAQECDRSMAHIQETLAGERWESVEIAILRRDGQVRTVLWNSANVQAPDGRTVVATIAQGQDITERKKAEEELLRLNRELRAISDCNQAIVRATDEQALFTDVSRIMCDVVGYRMAWVGIVEHDEAKSLRPVAWGGAEDGYLANANITWADRERGRGPTGTAARTGKTDFCQDFVSEPRAAPWREAALALGLRSSIAIPLSDVSRNIWGVFTLYAAQPNGFTADEVKLLEELAGDLAFGVSVLRIRAERRKDAESLRQRTLELEASNKELESFSYTVSHDLRAPLRIMDGYSKALLEDYADRLDDQGREWLGNIRSSSQRMAQLIDDILGLSRVVRAELKRETVSLSDEARSVAERLQNTEPGRRVEFAIAPGIEVWGDANLLRLVLENLLGNSLKFTARQPVARIEFGVTERAGRQVCYVRDNGIGFDMKYVDKLFKPFQRLHSDKEFPGTGIGLVTVHRIVKRHGGDLWAEGEVGKGAVFYFTLG